MRSQSSTGNERLMSLNIWYVSKYITPPGKGTVGGRGYFLMKELALMGCNIVLITSNSNQLVNQPKLDVNYLIQEVDGMQLCWVRTIKYSAAKSVRRILSWLHFEWRLLWLPKQQLLKPDVVVVSSLSLLTILTGMSWRMRYKSRLIFEVRDIWPLTLTEEGGFSDSNPLIKIFGLVEHLGYKYSDAIVGTMPNLGEHVKQVLGYPKKTYCIPMGIDVSNSVSPKTLPSAYEAFYFPSEKFVVAYAGSIGIANALNIFFNCAEMMKDMSEIHFLVVGEGDLLKSFQQKYSYLCNLTFVPGVPKEMVQSILTKCDLLYFSVHASNVWKYGQSLNKVIDYMMAGKPIVASYTGYPSMIDEAACGTYIPAGDDYALKQEIIRYYNMCEDERHETGARGRDWLMQNRPYKKLAIDYLDILHGTKCS